MSTKSKRISKAEEVVEYRPKPQLRIYSNELKSVKDMKVGETRTFIVTAKVKALNQGDEYGPEDNDKTVCATLRVTDIKEE